jgi:succinyl-diaminopimelate desuccinylase
MPRDHHMNATARTTISTFLDSERDRQTAFLAALVREPSDNPPGDCAPHAELAARLLEGMGFVVERYPIATATAQAAGILSCTNLIVRDRLADGGLVLACNAHGDVVPPGLGWTTGPYTAEIHNGFMYGRGAAVSKSDFATYAFALLALRQARRESPVKLSGVVELHFTWDEETGGEAGPKWLLARQLTKPDFVISAGFSYGIVTAHNGCLHLEVNVVGKSAHAARPETGKDALEAANGILSELYAYRRRLASKRSSVEGIGSPTLVVGLITGGINTNVVPDGVIFRIDRRILPDEDPEQVAAELTAIITASAQRWTGISCEVRIILLARPLVPHPAQDRLVDAICINAREVFGVQVRTHGSPLYTDARHYSEAGIPVVLYGAGPRTLQEANGHCADERLSLADLHGATKVVALTMLDMLSA